MDEKLAQVPLDSDSGQLFLGDVAMLLLKKMEFHRVRRKLHSVLWVANRLSTQTVFGWYDNRWRGDQGWLSYQNLKEVNPSTTSFLIRGSNPLLRIAKVYWVPILSIVPACGGTFRFPDLSVLQLKGKEAFASSISFAESNLLIQTTKEHSVSLKLTVLAICWTFIHSATGKGRRPGKLRHVFNLQAANLLFQAIPVPSNAMRPQE
jgi:hypothetical protein